MSYKDGTKLWTTLVGGPSYRSLYYTVTQNLVPQISGRSRYVRDEPPDTLSKRIVLGRYIIHLGSRLTVTLWETIFKNL